MKKFLTLFLCLIILLSGVSCASKSSQIAANPDVTVENGDKAQKKENKGTKKITLYFNYSDSLNPYAAQSSGNKSLMSLLFDSLVEVDNDFSATNVLASKIDVSGKKVVIDLGSYKFSDGSYVTGADVVYSIEQCKKAKQGAYVNQLENVSSYSASSNTIYLTLKREDKNVCNLLDFPIIKKGTVNKTNSDGKNIAPVGTGRYVLHDNLGEFSLRANEHYFGGKPENEIQLKNIPDYDALEYLIRSNTIDAYYNDFDLNDMPKLSKSKSVNLTNLVYLGLNHNASALKDKNIRQAISYAVDRKVISEKCYYSYSTPALSLFTQKSSLQQKAVDIFNSEQNSAKAIELLKKSGYTHLNASGYYQNDAGEIVSLNLLCNSKNNMQSLAATNISKQLKSCGIKVTLIQTTAKDYANQVKNKNYEIYLAEIRLTKSFDYTSLLNTKVVYSSSKAKSNGFLKVYKSYMSGKTEVEDMLENFSVQMPFVPLVFRVGTLNFSDRFNTELEGTMNNPYKNIDNLYLK